MESLNKVNERLRSSVIKSITNWGDVPSVNRVMRFDHEDGINKKSKCIEYGCPALILAAHEAVKYEGGGSVLYSGTYDFYPFQDRIQKLWNEMYETKWFENLEHKKGRGQLKTFFRGLTNKDWRYLRSGD